jgi:16S rRNA C967 or C1407 C5-methylase (RsmB/RsmF family)/NOL1/NOP2/fmu family ribosome biogenesis protein
MSTNTNIPQKLLDSLQEVNCFDETAFIEAHEQSSITSVRVNKFKYTAQFEQEENVPWCSSGKYLQERPSFVADPLWHAGAYYVQEASSMLLEQVLKQTVDFSKQLILLDACASPGGKSTLVASLINEESLLISNEIIQTRVNTLVENIVKWGQLNTWVCNSDVKQIGQCENIFDVILIDAPCSGSGLFRKDKKAINEWSENNVTHCEKRQQRIFDDLENALCEEGILIYMTCSYSVQENEDMIDYIIASEKYESIELSLSPDWQIINTQSNIHNGFGYRCMPHVTKGEGFFLSVFRKKGLYNKYIPLINNELKATANQFDFEKFIEIKNTFTFNLIDSIACIHLEHKNYFGYFSKKLKLVKKGIVLGQIMHKVCMPDHELAMYYGLKSTIPYINVSLVDAIKYLKKDTIELLDCAKGLYIVRFEGIALGWIKNLGNRSNNYYPTKYRLLKNIF